MSTIEERVKKIVAEQLGVKEDEVTNSASFVEDLGADPEAVFERLEVAPLAAASLAQTHRAWLADGSAVVLKVRRPGIRDTVEADLRLMARLGVTTEAMRARHTNLE